MGAMIKDFDFVSQRFTIRVISARDLNAKLVGYKGPAHVVGRVAVRRDYSQYLYSDLKFRTRFDGDNPFGDDYREFTFPSEQDAEEAYALYLLLQAG